MGIDSDLEDLFEHARRLSGDEREAFLADRCRGRPELLQELRELLGVSGDADKLFDRGFARSAEGSEKSDSEVPWEAEGAGDRIGPYHLLEPIGEGGCGRVYLAEQETPVRRRVAIKVIKLGMDTRQVISRFAAEQQVLAMMDHPNIARVLDGGASATGRPYFVMELVRGEKITNYCEAHRLSIRDRLQLFLSVCRALQHAHQKGILHRDIKPSNVLVTEVDGVAAPKVIDFGIAKALHGAALGDPTAHTRVDQFVGTPAYVSPEQALGGADVDTRSDLYSLGVLLYELLTGRTPFSAEALLGGGMETFRRKVREEEPERPSVLLRRIAEQELKEVALRRGSETTPMVRQVRGDLDWIVMKCLEKDRTRRYETVKELVSDLERFLRNEPVLARPPDPGYRLLKLVQRNKVAVGAAGIVFFALAASTVVSTYRYLKEREAVGIAEAARREQTRLREEAERAEHARTEDLWRSYLAQASAARHSTRPGRRDLILSAVSEAAKIRSSPELRKEAIAGLAMTDLGRPTIWRDFPAKSDLKPAQQPAADAKLERYAVVSPDDDLYIRRMSDRADLLRVRQAGRGASKLVFSPDGRWLAVRYFDGAVRLWDTGRSELEMAVRLAREVPESLDFTPDSAFLLAGTSEGGRPAVYFFAMRPEGEARVAKAVLEFDPAFFSERDPDRKLEGTAWANTLLASPDGDKLLVASFGGWQVWDWKLGHLLDEQPRRATVAGGFAWRPNGRSIVIADEKGEMVHRDVETGIQASMLGHKGVVHRVEFHPRGDCVASASWDGTMRLWDANAGREMLVTEEGFHAGFSVAGDRLAYSNNNRMWGLWPVGLSPIYRSISGRPRNGWELESSAFSPDGRFLLWVEGGFLWWLDLATGELRERRVFGVSRAVFDSDRRRLIVLRDGRLYSMPVRISETGLELGDPVEIDSNISSVVSSIQRSPGATTFVTRRTWGYLDAGDRIREFAWPGVYSPWNTVLSRDGKWAALGSWGGATFLCDATSGRVLREWSDIRSTRVSFTPDSRWLVLGSMAEYHFVDLATDEFWSIERPLAGDAHGVCAFSQNEPLAAVATSRSEIQLFDLQRRTTVAELTSPTPSKIQALAFSPDDGLLVCTTTSELQIWDLSLMRRELRRMGLDWSAEPLKESPFRPAALQIKKGNYPVHGSIPPRDATASSTLIDLSQQYHCGLDETWHTVGNRLGDLVPGVQKLGGVLYDVRGTVHARGLYNWLFPTATYGIPVHQHATTLHFVHATAWSAPRGTQIGGYRVHYADRSEVDVPLVFGVNIADWWVRVGDEVGPVERVFSGQSRDSALSGARTTLYHFAWKNPFPEKRIETVDFYSTRTQCSPFLAAITASVE